jgi:serine/threonine protein kinase
MAYCEKVHAVTQLLVALFAVHSLGFYHNAVKSSNCVLASDGRLLLTDFAPHKPLFLEEDDLG